MTEGIGRMSSPAVRFVGQRALFNRQILHCKAALHQGGPAAMVWLTGGGIASAQARLDFLRERVAGGATHLVGGSIPPDSKLVFAELRLPEMIDMGNGTLLFMRDRVTAGLFRQVMEDYEPKGPGADLLIGILDGKHLIDGEHVGSVNYFDTQEFASRLSRLTGRLFRIPTIEEFMAFRKKMTDQMGRKHWEQYRGNNGNTYFWTSHTRDNGGNYRLGSPGADPSNCYYRPAGHRTRNYCIQLVEDLSPEGAYTQRPAKDLSP